jgi:hypothetical protein
MAATVPLRLPKRDSIRRGIRKSGIPVPAGILSGQRRADDVALGTGLQEYVVFGSRKLPWSRRSRRSPVPQRSAHNCLKAELDLKAPQRYADDAEEDAEFAIAYAYWAVEEAKYRVLDAVLARKDAESM